MKTRLRTALIYKQAAQLPSTPLITQPFCEGRCSGWGQTADAAHRLIIADGFEWSLEWDPSKKSWLHSYSDRTPWTDQGLFLYPWMRQHSAWRLSLSIVLINCRWLDTDLFLWQLQEIGWEKHSVLSNIILALLTIYDDVCLSAHPCMSVWRMYSRPASSCCCFILAAELRPPEHLVLLSCVLNHKLQCPGSFPTTQFSPPIINALPWTQPSPISCPWPPKQSLRRIVGARWPVKHSQCIRRLRWLLRKLKTRYRRGRGRKQWLSAMSRRLTRHDYTYSSL